MVSYKATLLDKPLAEHNKEAKKIIVSRKNNLSFRLKNSSHVIPLLGLLILV